MNIFINTEYPIIPLGILLRIKRKADIKHATNAKEKQIKYGDGNA